MASTQGNDDDQKVSEHARALSAKGAAKGGLARAASLTRSERKAIAKKAAEERWAKAAGLPKETHAGVLKLGEGIPCSVLDNGMRVFSVNGLARSFGSGAKGRTQMDDGSSLPPILAAANIRPYIAEALLVRLGSPIAYRSMHGGRPALGYEAEILHEICDTLLEARNAGVLRKSQMPTAIAAETLIRGFARVGVVALIDEATGYQAERARDELQKILEAYISKELLPWTRRFPDEFFEQVYRLHGWTYKVGSAKRPQYVGKIINRYVYEALPDGVLDELRRKNPVVKNGRRKTQHHRWLTEHTGEPHLDRQIVAVTTIMKLSSSKDAFLANFRKLYPRPGEQLELDLEVDPNATTALPAGAARLPAVGGVEVGDLVGSVSERILEILRRGGAVSSKDIALAVYGSDKESTRNKLRKTLARLKEQGLAVSPSPGIWRIAETPLP